MVRGRSAPFQEFATVTGVFVLVCGGVLSVAAAVPPPSEPPPPEVVEMQKHAEEASVALQEREYEQAKTAIEAMCAQVESLAQGSRQRTEPRRDGKPVTLAK